MSATCVDIAIVGSGLVGSTLANLLSGSSATKDLSIALIDKVRPDRDVDLNHFDPRVVALSAESIAVLETAGVWSAVQELRACPYTSMVVWDAEGTGNIRFDARDSHADQLGFICENRVILSALTSQLEDSGAVLRYQAEIKAMHELADQRCLTFADGACLNASLVLAADGADSILRRLARVDTSEWDYGHTAIVTTVETEKSHKFCAWQRFSLEGPLAFLPLSKNGEDSNSCSIVWSLKSDQADAMMSLGEAAFCEMLGKAFENKLGKVRLVDKRFAIPLRQRNAKSYVQKSLALLGDSAHTIHPLAGQGVNLGLYDAKVLVSEIQRAFERGVPLSEESILRRYERQRRPQNLIAMAAMESFKYTFSSDDLALKWLRNSALNFVDRHHFIKQFFTQAAAGKFVDG